MNCAELEGLAEWAYRAARLPDDAPAPGLELLRRLVGHAVPVIASDCMAVGARLARTPEGGWVVYLRTGRWSVAAQDFADLLLLDSGLSGYGGLLAEPIHRLPHDRANHRQLGLI